MSDHSHDDHGHGHGHDAHGHGGGGVAHAHVHPPAFYIRIWVILLVLLLVSFVGPWAEIPIITLLTAFGIAFVKAFLVMKHFMHLDTEQPFVKYFLATSVVFMVLFFAGVAPDVMNHSGTRWVNVAAQEEVARRMAIGEDHGTHGGGHAPAEGEHAPAPAAGH